MLAFARAATVGLVFLLGCAGPPPAATSPATGEVAETPASAPTPSGAAGSGAPQKASIEAVVARALERSEVPTGAVVLDGRGHLLVLTGTGGVDPSQQALRPGSTVKPLLALGAARAGVAPAPSYDCKGKYDPIEGLTCVGVHGPIDLAGAIEQSCNVYFYDLAHRLGLPGVHGVFRHYGFGQPTGLVAAENPGRMPGEEVLRVRQPNPKDDELWPAYAPIIGIGHGPLQVTPLQLTLAYAKLARELESSDEPALVEVKQQVMNGLRRVVESPTGTGHAALVPGLAVAGKTGSAEAGQFDDDPASPGENGWFVAFAPANQPQLVVGIVCLGGVGGKCAAPIAGAIFRDGLERSE